MEQNSPNLYRFQEKIRVLQKRDRFHQTSPELVVYRQHGSVVLFDFNVDLYKSIRKFVPLLAYVIGQIC